AKRVATRQALSLANEAGKISIIEAFDSKGKVKPTVDLMSKLGANRRTLLVVDNKDDMVVRATRNVANLKVVQATYVSVFDVLNADKVIITKPSLDIISTWLGGAK
ncbi:MAG: 50S ribosomal protein L4, partial [Candidatus Saccharimonadales bacterium]